MRCNWCGKGEGKNFTKDRKNGMTYYYVCFECIGDFAEDKRGYYKQMESANGDEQDKIERNLIYIKSLLEKNELFKAQVYLNQYLVRIQTK